MVFNRQRLVGRHWFVNAVGAVVVRLGGDDVAEQVAWLHDVLEDTPTNIPTLNYNFGAGITEAVMLLTKRNGVAYEDYIEGVRNNPLALLVKKADTLCNLIQSTLQGNRKRIMKYTTQLQLLTAE